MKKVDEEVPAEVSVTGEVWAQEQMPSYYYGEFRTPSRVFADEVDKHKMLGILKNESENWNMDVLAFSLTDDQLQVLLCEDGKRSQENGGEFLQQLGEDYDGYFDGRGNCHAMVRENLNWKTVPQSNVLGTCSNIHANGTAEGYSKRGLDYWWSSYISYCGIYDWKFVNKDLLMEQFSIDPEEAYTLYTGRSRRGRHRSYSNKSKRRNTRSMDSMDPQPATG